MLNLERCLAFIDIESTGVDPAVDRIIDFAVVKITPGVEDWTRWSCRCNPGIPIPPAATECHGIKDSDVESCFAFSAYARKIHRGLAGCDIAGYNITQFDVPLLWEELYRCGIEWDLTGVRMIDALQVWRNMEPRKLENAVEYFCGRQHTGAHGAASDAEGAAFVSINQAVRYALDFGGLVEKSKYDSDREYVDVARRLYRDVDGDLVFGFGKHQGSKVHKHQHYVDWMRGQNFPGSTMLAIERELKRVEAIVASCVRAEEHEPLSSCAR